MPLTPVVPDPVDARAVVAQAQGAILRDLLTQDPRCRRLWVRRADRRSGQAINSAAVARLLAEWLWEEGEVSLRVHDLPRRLKDTVSRALRGVRISPRTLEAFIGAFDLDEATADRLRWPDPGVGRAA